MASSIETLFNAKLKVDRIATGRPRALSQPQYNTIVSYVLGAKFRKFNKPSSFSSSDNLLLEKYDVLEGDRKRLIVPLTNVYNTIYYVHDDELFEIFMQTHLSLDHGDRDQMMMKLKNTYKNIIYTDIIIFLSLCKHCLKNQRSSQNEADIRSAQFNNQCSLNIIDSQTVPDGDFKYVLVYQEQFTKFSLLKPLKSKEPQEVADNLINIFGIFGPPSLLQSNCGTRFLDNVIDILKSLWPCLETERMKSEDGYESSMQDVETMITKWMRNNNKTRWSEGIRFVQLKLNTILNKEINKTPYEALFKYSVKIHPNKHEGGETDGEIHNADREELDEDANKSDLEDTEMKEEKIDVGKTEVKEVCARCGREVEDEGGCPRCGCLEQYRETWNV